MSFETIKMLFAILFALVAIVISLIVLYNLTQPLRLRFIDQITSIWYLFAAIFCFFASWLMMQI